VFAGWDPSGPCRIIVFGERREDDQIFIEYWDQEEPPFNSPTIDQREMELLFEERDLDVPREVFSRKETYRAADRVYELMSEYYGAQEEFTQGHPENLVRFPPRLRRVR
jgi:hypothetical protein